MADKKDEIDAMIFHIERLEIEKAQLMSLHLMIKKVIALNLIQGPGLEHLVNIVFPKPVGGGWEGCNPKIVGFTKEFEAVWDKE